MEDSVLRDILLTNNNNSQNTDMKSVISKATSAYTVNPTNHGQKRMIQRNITKKELQKARKYGKKEIGHNNRYIYRYNGLVYITDVNSTEVITCYKDTSHSTINKTFGANKVVGAKHFFGAKKCSYAKK